MDGGIEVDRAIDEAMKTKKTQEVSARNPERKISNDVEGGGCWQSPFMPCRLKVSLKDFGHFRCVPSLHCFLYSKDR